MASTCKLFGLDLQQVFEHVLALLAVIPVALKVFCSHRHLHIKFTLQLYLCFFWVCQRSQEVSSTGIRHRPPEPHTNEILFSILSPTKENLSFLMEQQYFGETLEDGLRCLINTDNRNRVVAMGKISDGLDDIECV